MKWSRTHELARQRILEKLAEQTRPFEDMGEAAQRDRRALPFLEWCQTYLPHYFDKPFAKFHRRMVDAAGGPDLPTFVCVFRGAGKSVLLALARPLHRTLNQEVPYWVYGSGTQRLAAQNMDYVRLELEHNERLRCDYPDLRIDGEETEWVVDFRSARAPDGTMRFNSTKFEAFGTGMSPRGRRHVQHRPYEFVGDDLENNELARNPEREKQLWEWLMRSVEPALVPGRFVFTVLCTMFGPGCMIQRARKEEEKRDPEGRPVVKTFVQPVLHNGVSVWPDVFTDTVLARKRLRAGLTGWNREYMMNPADPSKPFQEEWVDRHRYREGAITPDTLDVVAFLDPALSEAPTGCPRAMVVAAADGHTGRRYVLDARIEQCSPQRMIEWVFETFERWRPRVIGIESNGGYALLRLPIEAEMRRRGWVPIRYVEHQHEGKDTRIGRLQPQVESGRWWFPEQPSLGVQTLEEQLTSYPDGFVDGPDAMAGCDELLPNAWRPGPAGPGLESRGRRRNLAGVL